MRCRVIRCRSAKHGPPAPAGSHPGAESKPSFLPLGGKDEERRRDVQMIEGTLPSLPWIYAGWQPSCWLAPDRSSAPRSPAVYFLQSVVACMWLHECIVCVSCVYACHVSACAYVCCMCENACFEKPVSSLLRKNQQPTNHPFPSREDSVILANSGQNGSSIGFGQKAKKFFSTWRATCSRSWPAHPGGGGIQSQKAVSHSKYMRLAI